MANLSIGCIRQGTSPAVLLNEIRANLPSICDLTEDGRLSLEENLWNLLKDNLVHKEAHAQRWWTQTGPILASLLRHAKYGAMHQLDVLSAYFSLLVPELGPRLDVLSEPLRWKSFMIDDGVPVEMSWDWGLGGKPPTIRLSLEPIGLYAGTLQDPWNSYAIARVIWKMNRICPGSDLCLFNHFSRELSIGSHGCQTLGPSSASESWQLRSFVAFDFLSTGIMLKAYFVPLFNESKTEPRTLEVIAEAISRVSELEALEFPAFHLLLHYLTTSVEGTRLGAEMLAIDCVSPTAARIKVYLRSQSTSFNSIRSNMTLGGKLRQRGLESGLLELEKLWRLVLPVAKNSSPDEELPRKIHRTAGILYYYDFKSKQSCPVPRIYIPVRHYGHNDLDIAKALETYLRGRGQDEWAHRYLLALQDI